MKNQADYSEYECPFQHIEKECGHELRGPEGYEKTYGVWCACGFRGPVFCLSPVELKLKRKIATQNTMEGVAVQTGNSRYVTALWRELLDHSLEPFDTITGVIIISYDRLNAALKKTMPHCT